MMRQCLSLGAEKNSCRLIQINAARRAPWWLLIVINKHLCRSAMLGP
jgi:hypothetical protein